MLKQTTKLEFFLKVALAVMFAIEAGNDIASLTEYSSPILQEWLPAFIYTFYPLACIVIMQWVLLSECLPKWWVFLGLVGCVLAATTVGIMFQFITNETYILYGFEIQTFRAIVSGILMTLPQLFVLKGKKGYLWVLVNSIGLAVRFIGWWIIFIPPIHDSFYLAFLRMLVLESPNILFGLILGLYLYAYIYNPNRLQAVEARSN
ncbi:MAG: hypothetical protein H7Y59_09635 [Anaerolineales bacterium]|nr:hypothetical protein [Anaerolineales bacterium]